MVLKYANNSDNSIIIIIIIMTSHLVSVQSIAPKYYCLKRFCSTIIILELAINSFFEFVLGKKGLGYMKAGMYIYVFLFLLIIRLYLGVNNISLFY